MAKLTENIVGVLIFALVMTFWSLGFQPLYEEWLLSQGAVMGVGEVYAGYVLPAIGSLILTWFVLRRLRSSES
ncbi:MAG: hypothetical protein HWN68_07755 [Desulfobacterales bacterium]|nr:hypothetical protein [Desulfobacterales bacterium]